MMKSIDQLTTLISGRHPGRTNHAVRRFDNFKTTNDLVNAGRRAGSKISTEVCDPYMNNYERLADSMSEIAAKLVNLKRRLSFDMKMARGPDSIQVAYDCMALERISLRLNSQVFSDKMPDFRSCLESQEDPCVCAIQSLQRLFTNIARLDHAVPYWPDSDSLREDIATLLRMAGTLLEEDLAQILDACRIQVVQQLATRDLGSTQDTLEDVSAAEPSDPSLRVLASSAKVQAASLEAMLNFKYVAQPEIAPAAENPPLVAGKSARARAGASLPTS
jgi:hypothetical protein